jgi:hypothetical protein
MRLRCIALLAATLATASVPAAQGPGGYGPPTPGTFKQLFALTDPQADQYSHGWDSLMAATTPQRDSARVAGQTMRSAFQDHDREAAQLQAQEDERRQRVHGNGADASPGSS